MCYCKYKEKDNTCHLVVNITLGKLDNEAEIKGVLTFNNLLNIFSTPYILPNFLKNDFKQKKGKSRSDKNLKNIVFAAVYWGLFTLIAIIYYVKQYILGGDD
ncbi:uncharacterized protein LOC131957246 isoform X2 [Physella acuta]|uniref:uncharacterized protein LOC131957246 isoform X2 n=1 Tax=Physella acuta TaxID=109671 RepID=UPI0027DD7226|nr:uncharacterized protein LOC131957246 isoform X2 [Physella acuta]